MKEYIVTKEILNIRSKPSDESDATYVGQLLKGERVWLDDEEIVGAVPKGGKSNVWKIKTGSRNVVAKDGVNQTFKWFNNLQIDTIWNAYHERGINANVAILDTGYNPNVPDIALAVKESKSFIISASTGELVNIDDTFGHGSHCASLVASRNENLICGCAPAVNLYVAKISSSGSVKNYSIIIDAIKWAIEKEADVISISYGGESNDPDLEKIINHAVNDRNILIVAAIGDVIPNSTNKPLYPALLDACIAVGAVDDNNAIDPVTIRSEKTEIYAPGRNITAYSTGSRIEAMTGTSQAAAIVAGICGLIISKYKNVKKNYTSSTIKQLLLANVDLTTDGTNKKIISPSKIFSKM
jgi:subtilisin family serine protease